VSEYKEGHIEGVENIFVGTLPDNLDKVDRNKEVVIHCQSGARAAIAQSILERNGVDKRKGVSRRNG
jgi:hydroxyacylglutathione hydrolase